MSAYAAAAILPRMQFEALCWGVPTIDGRLGPGAIGHWHAVDATPPSTGFTVHFGAANRAGRHQLVVRVRPLPTWGDDVTTYAISLLARYFLRIGGFRIIDQQVLQGWVYWLMNRSDELELSAAAGLIKVDPLKSAVLEAIWGIECKAQSLAPTARQTSRDKAHYIAHPRAYLGVSDTWIERSAPYQYQLHAALQVAARERAAAELAIQSARRQPLGAPHDDERRGAERAAALAAQDAFWSRLTEAQRMEARRSVWPMFAEGCRADGLDPALLEGDAQAGGRVPQLVARFRGAAVRWAQIKFGREAEHGLSAAP